MPDEPTPTGDPSPEEKPNSDPSLAAPPPAEPNKDPQPEPLDESGKRALDAERRARRDAEKAHKAAMTELEEFRRQSMSEHERAIADAKTEARQAALMEVGERVARAEFKAAASGRIDGKQLAALLDHIDLRKFVDTDGQVDADAVTKFVEGIAPAPEPEREPQQQAVPQPPTRPVDIGQGANRGATPMALNGSGLEDAVRRAVGA